MGRLEERWDRRQDTYRDGREPFAAQASVLVRAPSQAVWDFLSAPGSAVLLDPRHLKGFPVPGTPEEGVGHQWCSFMMGEQGRLDVTVSEVVEFEPPHRLVRKILNAAVPILESHTIADVPGGCSYAVGLGLRIAAGASGQVGPGIQKELDEHAAKLKALIEAGATSV